MAKTDSQHLTLVDSLQTLLSDSRLVSTLAEQGFTSIPKLLRQHLSRMADIEANLAETPVERKESASPFHGLCPQAASILSGRELPAMSIACLSLMSPARQVVVAQEMRDGRTHNVGFVRALLAATPRDLRIPGARMRKNDETRAIILSGIERSLVKLHCSARALEPGQHNSLFYLALASAVVRAWVRNSEVNHRLHASYPRHAAFLEQLATEASHVRRVARRVMKLSYK